MYDPIIKRFGMDLFPGVRILSDQGSVLGKPRAQPATVKSIVEAAEAYSFVEKRFQQTLARADMTKPETRLDYLKKHLARADDGRALELFRGFKADDPAEPRLAALSAIVEYLVQVNRLDEAEKLLEGAEARFPASEQLPRITKLRADLLYGRFKQAAVSKDRELCHDLLDELAARYPESEPAQGKEKLSAWIDLRVP